MPLKMIFKSALIVGLTIVLLSACNTTPAQHPSTSNLMLEMRRLNNSMADQAEALNTLNARLSDIETLQKNQAQEIAQLRQQGVPSTGRGAPNYQGSGGQQFPTVASQTQDRSPTEIYLQAFGNYASGRYPEAINGFEAFLQHYPNNSYASNAQFWLADSHYNLQEYQKSLDAFDQLLTGYPRTAKAPDALLKMATAYQQLGDTAKAQLRLEVLQQRYPDSPAAAKAQELQSP
jgi:tol-pal system protein YbgF